MLPINVIKQGGIPALELIHILPSDSDIGNVYWKATTKVGLFSYFCTKPTYIFVHCTVEFISSVPTLETKCFVYGSACFCSNKNCRRPWYVAVGVLAVCHHPEPVPQQNKRSGPYLCPQQYHTLLPGGWSNE